MKQEQITKWEKENQSEIIGWEISYGEKGQNNEWVPYVGFDIIFFKMNNGTIKEFKRDKPM